MVVVGQQEKPFSFVGASHVGRFETVPFRIEPECGKIAEDSRQSVLLEPWHLLQKE